MLKSMVIFSDNLGIQLNLSNTTKYWLLHSRTRDDGLDILRPIAFQTSSVLWTCQYITTFTYELGTTTLWNAPQIIR